MGVAGVRRGPNLRVEAQEQAQKQLADAYEVIAQQQVQIMDLSEAVAALVETQAPA